MKASEKKESVQIFEFDLLDMIKSFTNFLKSKGITVQENAKISFDGGVVPLTSIEYLKMTSKVLEEGIISTTDAKGKGDAKAL